jgi:hypothetical protein
MKRNPGRRNPRRKENQISKGTASMPTTKADLQEILDSIQDLADDALDPELPREDVIAKVKQIYDLASGDDSDEDTDDDDGSDDD